MPNIVITEGLDQPWELKNTESNITAETDLESINLANQVVGTLAHTASQLFGSLKTEKDNLDNIVDAIELINEEIALFPDRISKWDTVSLDIEKIDLSVFPSKFQYQPLAGATDINDNTLSTASVSVQGLEKNQKALDATKALIAAKPLLDAQNLSFSRTGAAFLLPTDPVQNYSAVVILLETKIVEGTTPGTGGNQGDLVVYRDTSGQPTSYEYVLDGRTKLNASQVSTFFVPKDDAEKNIMQAAINSSILIDATNALVSTTGLPAGVTPPVTKLGASVEKYYDTARYEMTEYIRDGSSIIPVPNSNKTMYGAYPPVPLTSFDLSKMTQSDVGKYYQRPGEDTIYYIAEVRTNGQVVIREGSETFGTTKFVTKMTDNIKKSLRGEYAEKQILLTQRSTDQTLFVTSITQRYTTFSDMATNLLKTLVNFYNDLARNIRG